MEHFTTKCNVISNGVTILKKRNVSITIHVDPKRQTKQWDGLLYLTGNVSIIFYRSQKNQIYEIELTDGRKGQFYVTQPGKTVAIKGSDPLE